MRTLAFIRIIGSKVDHLPCQTSTCSTSAKTSEPSKIGQPGTRFLRPNFEDSRANMSTQLHLDFSFADFREVGNETSAISCESTMHQRVHDESRVTNIAFVGP